MRAVCGVLIVCRMITKKINFDSRSLVMIAFLEYVQPQGMIMIPRLASHYNALFLRVYVSTSG